MELLLFLVFIAYWVGMPVALVVLGATAGRRDRLSALIALAAATVCTVQTIGLAAGVWPEGNHQAHFVVALVVLVALVTRYSRDAFLGHTREGAERSAMIWAITIFILYLIFWSLTLLLVRGLSGI